LNSVPCAIGIICCWNSDIMNPWPHAFLGASEAAELTPAGADLERSP